MSVEEYINYQSKKLKYQEEGYKLFGVKLFILK
jgi:hypothetical protein